MSTTKTLQDLRNQSYWILKADENSKAYSPMLMDSFINKAQNDICIGNLFNLKTAERLLKPTLNFLAKEAYFKSVQRGTISWAIALWATTIPIASTTNYLSSGALWIDGMIVTYTGITGASFTGCSGVITAMWAGAKLYALFALPSDFWQMTSAYYIPSSGGMQSKMIGIDYRDFKESFLNRITYSIQTNSLFSGEVYYTIVNGLYFLPFTPQSANNIRFEYQKLPTSFSLVTDIATVPDTYVLNTIPYVAVAEMLFNRWEPDIAIELNNFGYNSVKTMYAFYSSQSVELNYNQRLRTSRDWILNI